MQENKVDTINISLSAALVMQKIAGIIQNKLNSDEALSKLLNDLKENTELIDEIKNSETEGLFDLAQAGYEILEELQQKIKAENRNIAALLNTEFNKIRDYYLPWLKNKIIKPTSDTKQLEYVSIRAYSSEQNTSVANMPFITGQNIEIKVATIQQYQANTMIIAPQPPAESLPEMWRVPQRNNSFTGRSEMLEQIANCLNHESTKHLILTAHGLGGIGKTQLTLEYVWRNYKNYKGVCWFNAESKDRLLSDYINLGHILNLFSESQKNLSVKERALIVKAWLEHSARAGWLLVYDNALKQDDISDCLPIKEGKILITSRHTHWKYQTLEVKVFALEEAQEYMKKIIGEKIFNVDHANQLISLLGYLPLALAQACAYL